MVDMDGHQQRGPWSVEGLGRGLTGATAMLMEIVSVPGRAPVALVPRKYGDHRAPSVRCTCVGDLITARPIQTTTAARVSLFHTLWHTFSYATRLNNTASCDVR